MLRVAGSLLLGWVTASLFLSKLKSFPQQNDLASSFAEYGRMIKTIFILRYLMNQPYRRKINNQREYWRKIARFTPISLFCSSRGYQTATVRGIDQPSLLFEFNYQCCSNLEHSVYGSCYQSTAKRRSFLSVMRILVAYHLLATNTLILMVSIPLILILNQKESISDLFVNHREAELNNYNYTSSVVFCPFAVATPYSDICLQMFKIARHLL